MAKIENREKFWSGKRVFITGHTGFKGVWLTLALKHFGADVYGYSLKPETTPNLFDQLNISGTISHTVGDVRNREDLMLALVKANPHIIFHLAAQPIVLEAYKNPIETIDTNILGVANLLDIVRTSPSDSLRSVVIITSDKCYQNDEKIWAYREYDKLGGSDIYSASKACAEIISNAFNRSFFEDKLNIAIATARAGNVIGGGDRSENRIIPDMVRAIEADESITLRNPNASRPWQFVLDPINGYMRLAEELSNNHIDKNLLSSGWNFGPDASIAKTVIWLVNEFIKDSCGSAEISIQKGSHKEHALLNLDSTKANTYLDWHPLYDAKSAIRLTASWHKAEADGANLLEYSNEQVNNFFRTDKEAKHD